MLLALLLIPSLAGLVAFVVRPPGLRRALLPATAAAHAAVCAAAWFHPPAPAGHGWLALDAPGQLFLSLSSGLFLAAACHAVGYLRRETQAATTPEAGLGFEPVPEAIFIVSMLWLLAAMTLVAVSQHFGLLWAAIEATSLAGAPLICFRGRRRTLDAAWKYLLVCSVGIALALLGNFFLAVAAAGAGAPARSLLLQELLAGAAGLNAVWLKAAFLLLLAGYGARMGLAPMHTWLPDACSEAPSVLFALLSGAVLNGAFLGLLRIQQVCGAAGLGGFGRELLVLFGLLSIVVAAIFIPGQADYKRLLAYSSVEHMGILALGVGLGGGAVSGAFLHAVSHSLAKAMLFLVAGNILFLCQTRLAAQVRGVRRLDPVAGWLWIAGFFAIAGSPPFGLFVSGLVILQAAIAQHRWVVVGVYLGGLALIFMGMAGAMLNMAQGEPDPRHARKGRAACLLADAPPLALGALVLVLGLYLPPGLKEVIREAARLLGGT